MYVQMPMIDRIHVNNLFFANILEQTDTSATLIKHTASNW
jgi:hypothetical protein